jgi:hypothetical protein
MRLIPADEERTVVAAAAGLEHGSAKRKHAALRELIQMVSHGNRQAIVMFAKLLAASEPDTIQQALGMLSHAPPVEDDRVLGAVFSQLKHSDVEIRFLALKAVGTLSPSGNAGAIEALCHALEDTNAHVRVEATATLAKVAPRDDANVLLSLAPRLNHKCEEIRILALKVLTQVSSTGCQSAIAAATKLLEDRDYRVRQEAMKAVNKLAPEGHENLAIVGPSVQHAIFSVSSRLMRSQPSAPSILSQVGQQVGQSDVSMQGLDDEVEWNECKAMSLAATAYGTQSSLAAKRTLHDLSPSHQRSNLPFNDIVMSAAYGESCHIGGLSPVGYGASNGVRPGLGNGFRAKASSLL